MRTTISSLAIPASIVLVLGLSACQGSSSSSASATGSAASNGSSGTGAVLHERTSAPTSETITEAAPEKTSSAHATDLSVGDCVKSLDDTSQINEVTLVDCNQPHLYEVYYNHDITASTLPATDAMTEEVHNACAPSFEEYVGISYSRTTKYDVFTLTPSASSWIMGDRTITCMITSRDGTTELTGSARGDAQ